MVWKTKGTKSLSFLILCSFYKKKLSVMLQQPQATFIFECAIIVDEDFFNVCVFSRVPPFLLNLMFFSKRWGGVVWGTWLP